MDCSACRIFAVVDLCSLSSSSRASSAPLAATPSERRGDETDDEVCVATNWGGEVTDGGDDISREEEEVAKTSGEDWDGRMM